MAVVSPVVSPVASRRFASLRPPGLGLGPGGLRQALLADPVDADLKTPRPEGLVAGPNRSRLESRVWPLSY